LALLDDGSTVVNHGEGVKETDSIDADIEIDTGIASLGYYTPCIMVWDGTTGMPLHTDVVK
jgi:hypothetical protein